MSKVKTKINNHETTKVRKHESQRIGKPQAISCEGALEIRYSLFEIRFLHSPSFCRIRFFSCLLVRSL